MIKNFEQACKTYKYGLGMEKSAEKVLDVLLTSNKRMRAKEIAPLIDMRCTYQDVTRSLRWLTELGLVKRTEVDGKPIKVETYHLHYDESDVKVIDGEIYIKKDARKVNQTTVIPKIAYFEIA